MESILGLLSLLLYHVVPGIYIIVLWISFQLCCRNCFTPFLFLWDVKKMEPSVANIAAICVLYIFLQANLFRVGKTRRRLACISQELPISENLETTCRNCKLQCGETLIADASPAFECG